MHQYTGLPFMAAFVVGLAAMGLHIYDVHARHIGIGKAEPWRSASESAVERVSSLFSAFGAFVWRHRLAFACLVVLCIVLWQSSATETSGVVLALNIPALERDLTKLQSEAKSLFEKHTKAADAEERELTAEERKEVQAVLDKAKPIKDKIDRAKADASMLAQIDAMVGQETERLSAIEAARGKKSPKAKSLGEQFVSSEQFQAFHKLGRNRGTKWATGVVELHSELLDSDAGSPGSGGDLIVPDYRPGILPILFPRLVVADLLAPGNTDSNLIVYMQETFFENNADTVLEGAVKPESSLRFDQAEDRVHKIAHWLPVTEEMLEDVPQLRSYIDARLRLGVSIAEENKLLNGAASPAELTGILNRTGLRAAEIAGGSPDSPNADAVYRQMMGILNDAFVMPDGIVMNPTNWQTIQLMKDSSGAYMGGGPFNLPPVSRLWGLPVVQTPAITAGTALVGAFRSAAQIFRKGGIRVEASNSHDDYFIRNLVAIRAEERLALAVYRPGAFGTVTGLD